MATTTFLRRFAIVLCLGVVLFFGLKSDPEVPNALAPVPVRVYFNSHDALRNQLAFGLFGVAVLFALRSGGFLNRPQIVAVSLIAVLIPALEVAQLWMPERHVDFDDVVNGWLGLAAACALYAAVWWIWQIAIRRRPKN